MNQEVTQTAIVTMIGGIPKTTSLIVAEKFDKRHDDVLKAVRNLECSEEFRLRNFAESSYLNAQNKSQPMYEMTRQGFSFLAMGLTGKEAAKWKEAYIDAFDRMEAELAEQVVFQGLVAQVGELQQDLAETLALAKELTDKNGALIQAFRARLQKAIKIETISAEKDLAKELRAIVKKCGSDNPKAIKEAAHALVDKNPERYKKSECHPYAFVDAVAIGQAHSREFSEAVKPVGDATIRLRAKLAPGGSTKAIGHMGGAA